METSSHHKELAFLLDSKVHTSQPIQDQLPLFVVQNGFQRKRKKMMLLKKEQKILKKKRKLQH